MLTIVQKDGLMLPSFRCDVCKELIKDAEQANVEWSDWKDTTKIRVVHKHCCRVECSAYPYHNTLDVFLWQLLANVKYKSKEAKESARFLTDYVSQP